MITTIKKIGAVLLKAIAIMGTAVVVVIIVLLLMMCKNEKIQKNVSPTGKYAAYAFVGNCGASSSYSPQVIVLKRWKPFLSHPYISFLYKNDRVFGSDRGYNIKAEWKDDRTLVITCDSNLKDIYLEKTSLYDIGIKYVNKVQTKSSK